MFICIIEPMDPAQVAGIICLDDSHDHESAQKLLVTFSDQRIYQHCLAWHQDSNLTLSCSDLPDILGLLFQPPTTPGLLRITYLLILPVYHILLLLLCARACVYPY
jgi:hypothetical protein